MSMGAWDWARAATGPMPGAHRPRMPRNLTSERLIIVGRALRKKKARSLCAGSWRQPSTAVLAGTGESQGGEGPLGSVQGQLQLGVAVGDGSETGLIGAGRKI